MDGGSSSDESNCGSISVDGKVRVPIPSSGELGNFNGRRPRSKWRLRSRHHLLKPVMQVLGVAQLVWAIGRDLGSDTALAALAENSIQACGIVAIRGEEHDPFSTRTTNDGWLMRKGRKDNLTFLKGTVR